MKIIGLTGGIGCGKSTVSALFAARGITIIDADEVAHDLMRPEAAGWCAFVERWGTTFLQEDGFFNRPKLREHFFHHPVFKREWEACLHPLIFSTIVVLTEEKKSEWQKHHVNAPYLMWSIPLLFESKHGLYDPHLWRRLVIDVSVDVQVQRVSRRGVPLETIYTIMRSQVSRATRLAQADDILFNYAVPDRLAVMVEAIHHYYVSLLAH